MKRPLSLKSNDKAIIISPAGSIDRHLVEDAASVLEKWGLAPEISEHALDEKGRFSGSEAHRLFDLQEAFDDRRARLILCARGGYGTVHLLPRIDFTGIRRFPKWVVGFSDITALHAALQHHGVASIHGPMAAHFSREGVDDVSVRLVKSILAGQPVCYSIPSDLMNPGAFLNRTGAAKGRLFGGNLSVFCGIMGSRYARIPDKGLLFIEDTGEAPYRVDRMIHQLKLAGVFNRISGMIVGRFTDYEEDDQMYRPLYESILHVVEEYDFPVCFNFPVGHVKLNFPLIMGVLTELRVNNDSVFLQQ